MSHAGVFATDPLAICRQVEAEPLRATIAAHFQPSISRFSNGALWIENPRVAGSIPALGTIFLAVSTNYLRLSSWGDGHMLVTCCYRR